MEKCYSSSSRRRSQTGFTLLELLVVIAILATIGGAVLVAYEGLEDKASGAMGAHGIAATDRAVRTFRVLQKNHPDVLDTLVDEDGTPVTTDFYAGLHANLQGPDGLVNTADGILAPHVITPAELIALNAAGMTSGQFIDSALVNAVSLTPNRDFDLPANGIGATVALTSVTSTAGNVVTELDAATKATIGFLATDVILVFGLGNNSTIVGSDNGMASAPYDSGVGTAEYGRFLVLYQVADVAGTFLQAKFVGALDATGEHLDQNVADSK